MSFHFDAAILVEQIMGCESMPRPAKLALNSIGENVRLHCFANDRRSFTFMLQNKELPNGCSFLTIRAIKGSLHTVLWSTFARFDDEYALYYHTNMEDLQDNIENIYIVWSVKGLDAVNAKISVGIIDWFLLRRIQSITKAHPVGVLAFTKLLGRFLFSVPNFVKHCKYYPPMPATFMFNYLMMVCYCPFELITNNLQDFLCQSALHSSSAGQSHKDLLKAFILPNGSGAWIPGYVPKRMATGDLVLQYTPHTQQREVVTVESSNEWEKERKNIAEHHQEHLYAALSNRNKTSPCSHSLVECGAILQETAVRVVELRFHPLGVDGMIVVLEFVHNRHWSKIMRFVAVDAYKVCMAIGSANHTPPQPIQQIEIFDKEGWELSRQLFQKNPTFSTSPRSSLLAAHPLPTVSRDEHDAPLVASPVTGLTGVTAEVPFLQSLPLPYLSSPLLSPTLCDLNHSDGIFSPSPAVRPAHDYGHCMKHPQTGTGVFSVQDPSANTLEAFIGDGVVAPAISSGHTIKTPNAALIPQQSTAEPIRYSSPYNSECEDIFLVDMAAPDDPVPSSSNPWSRSKPASIKNKRAYSGINSNSRREAKSEARRATVEAAESVTTSQLDTASFTNSCEWGVHTGGNKKPSDFYVALILVLQSATQHT